MMTYSVTYKEPNPANFRPALAVVERYIAASYRLDPALAVEAAALSEAMEAAALIQQCPAHCITMHCRRTGQPVAYMPVSRLASHLPLTIAPNWMHTGPEAIDALSDTQPIAALVFGLMSVVFPGDTYCADVEAVQAEPDTVQRYAQRSDRLRELFMAGATLAPQALSQLASLFIEFHAVTSDAEKRLTPLRDVIRSSTDATMVFTALQAVIAREYAVMIARTKSLFHIQGAMALDDEALVDQVQQWLTKATGQRLSQMRMEVAAAKEKHIAAVKEATDRRRSASSRERDRVLKAAREAFGDALDAMFSPISEAAPVAPVTETVVRLDTAAHKPAAFAGFNIFKAAGAQ